MFTDPIQNLRALGLREDNIVADLGAGTGYYTLAISGIVSRGKVYAIDINKDFLTTIQNRVIEAQLSNVGILWGNVEMLGGTRLGDDIIDAVIASNIFFQVEDKHRFIEEIKRILKPGGRVLVIDWEAESSGKSPVVQLKGILPKSTVYDMFEGKGFVLDRYIDAGAYHYGMILTKS